MIQEKTHLGAWSFPIDTYAYPHRQALQPEPAYYGKFPLCYLTHLSPKPSTRLDAKSKVLTVRKLVPAVMFPVVRVAGRVCCLSSSIHLLYCYSNRMSFQLGKQMPRIKTAFPSLLCSCMWFCDQVLTNSI